MSVYDLARELGMEILKSEEAERIYKARAAFDADESAKALTDEYTTIKNEWQEKMADQSVPRDECNKLGEELISKEKEIKEALVTAELIAAETAFGAYVNTVYSVINSTISGQDGQNNGCDPNSCAGCGGGCH